MTLFSFLATPALLPGKAPANAAGAAGRESRAAKVDSLDQPTRLAGRASFAAAA